MNLPLNRSFSAVVLVLLLLLSCNKEGPNEPTKPDPPLVRLPIVPLTLGNSWEYAVVQYDTSGSIVGQWLEIHEISGDTSFEGKSFWIYDGFCANTDSGLIEYGFWLDTLKIRLRYKYPCDSGDVYLGADFAPGPPTVTYTVLSLDTLIQVPAGAFHCLKYRLKSGPNINRDIYVAPGVGRIKMIYYSSTPDFSLGHSLMVWQLNQHSLY